MIDTYRFATPTGSVEGQDYSPYLVGTFEMRNGGNTIIQVVNPNYGPVQVCTAFFAANGTGITGTVKEIAGNGAVEISAAALLKESPDKFGVVKVLSMKEGGVAGFQKDVIPLPNPSRLKPAPVVFTKTNMAAIPGEVAGEKERGKILSFCRR